MEEKGGSRQKEAGGLWQFDTEEKTDDKGPFTLILKYVILEILRGP